MVYIKNLPAWERVLRVVIAILALFYAYTHWESSYSVGIAIIAAMLSLTGLIGFCPMCAMVGRKPYKAK